MTFSLHGLNGHEAMPMNRLFRKRLVNEVEKVAPYANIHTKESLGEGGGQHHHHAGIADNTYKEIEKLPHDDPVLFANQIMSSPVEVLTTTATIAEALKLFHEKRFRHLPVLSSEKVLVGMVSDRDVLRYMGSITDKYKYQEVMHEYDDKVEELMSTSVLSASSDTDMRYIARLFVEERIGAMPVVEAGELSGIITRSDILRVVMSRHNMEYWV